MLTGSIADGGKVSYGHVKIAVFKLCVRSASFSFSVTSNKHLWHRRRHSVPLDVRVVLTREESQCSETHASRRPRRLCKSFNERINDVLSDCVYPLKGKVINHSEASHR